jgi:hypothetical protein
VAEFLWALEHFVMKGDAGSVLFLCSSQALKHVFDCCRGVSGKSYVKRVAAHKFSEWRTLPPLQTVNWNEHASRPAASIANEKKHSHYSSSKEDREQRQASAMSFVYNHGMLCVRLWGNTSTN